MELVEKVYLIKERLPNKEIIGRLWQLNKDPKLNSILQEEQSGAELGGIEILLLAPISLENDITALYLGLLDVVEVFDIVYVPKCGDVYAIVGKLDTEAYYIGLHPRPRSRKIWRDNFPDERDTIKHEIAHIKFGDCDRKLPEPLKIIFNWLIAEPRADWYERHTR